MSKYATPEGTARFAARHGGASGHFTAFEGLQVASVGLGTYLGDDDDATDRAYEAAIERAIESGCNLLDTAINYRCQRSERAIGAVLKQLFARGAVARDEMVISTKGGYLPFDGSRPADFGAYLEQRFIAPGLLSPGDLVGGSHCISPGYLAAQMDWSRHNLGLDTIDIYLLHNPESQLEEVSRFVFYERLHDAFVLLEERAARGDIRFYGTATWNGYREPKDSRTHLDLSLIAALANKVGGPDHHFRVIQLPYNLAMPEALTLMNQTVNGTEATVLEAAHQQGLFVMASASILQGNLARDLPEEIRSVFPTLTTDAQRSLEFTRSTPGVGAALVGMKTLGHVEENLAILREPRLTKERFLDQFTTAP